MSKSAAPIKFPRRRISRAILRGISGVVIHALSDFKIYGRENLPRTGPVIFAANHFHFSDPVFLLYASPRQLEFIAGFRMPNAPKIVRFLPQLWGTLPAFRGGYSRSTLTGALSVLEQGGPLALFPEGGTWATVLRKPRAGVGFLAVDSGAQVIPVAIDGAPGLFKSWRPKIRMTFGPPLGPFKLQDGAPRRAGINAVSTTIMKSIAVLLPDEQRGIYSSQENLRLEGQRESEFPFEKDGMRGQ